MTEASKTTSLEDLVEGVEAPHKRADIPEVRSGMTVAVYQRILEKGKVRTQIFEGMVLKSVRRAKAGASVTVRKVTSGVGVERTFFLHSPVIEKIEIKRQAKVRRAKLYYLRELSGRAAVQREQETTTTGPAKKA
ncbi:MAG: 50S ribosomal protein L19 [Parcubacteria group bacterium]